MKLIYRKMLFFITPEESIKYVYSDVNGEHILNNSRLEGAIKVGIWIVLSICMGLLISQLN